MIFGILLICVGINVIIFTDMTGFIAVGVGLFLIKKDGIELNLESKKYRELISFAGLNFGKWKAVPEFEYVSIFKTSENIRVRVVVAEANLKDMIYKVNLFYNRNKYITAYKTNDIDEAMKIGIEVGRVFQMDVLDATTPNQKWL
jgi:hypothetical protein